MSADYYEIVELPSGEIALRQLDGVDEAPLVTISFSPKARRYLKEHYAEVARAMMTVGLETATELVEGPEQRQQEFDALARSDQSLH